MAVVHETKQIPTLEDSLTRDQAIRLVYDDPEFAIFLLMRQAAEIERQNTEIERQCTEIAKLKNGQTHAPSSATPIYKKPTTKSGRSRKTKRGAKVGHKGSSREVPVNIDRREEHILERCPECDGEVSPLCGKSARRKRIIEDIPEEIESEVVEHTINRYWCPHCKKKVEPKVIDASQGSTLGHRVTAFTAWLRFGVGISLSQITEVLNAHLHFNMSNGGIIESSHRVAEIFLPWYEQIGKEVKSSGALHADETGWRVIGKTHWLWCFCARDSTYYMIDRSRGSPALSKFFTEAIDGILIIDFWNAYNAVACGGRQRCYPHLFRDIDETDKKDASEEWQAFRKKLMRLLRDALRLYDKEVDSETRASRRARLDTRLERLIAENGKVGNDNVSRYLKRLKRHQNEFFTFLDYSDVPADNNFGEREIRPAVMLRKRSQGNQSEKGAATSAVLMSIFRTLHRRGHDPLAEIVSALRYHTLHGVVPALPATTATG